MISLVSMLALAPSAAGRIAIDHAPVECVLYDRYARIAATGTPAEGVASAQLQFRAQGDGGWYSVGMAAEATEWSAYLPRPIRPLARLEYRIVMRSSDAGEAATPAFSVRVGGDAECGSPAESSAAVAAPIVVRVPAGAPVVPPVPAGFSPAGVVAVDEHVRTSGLKTLAIGAGIAGGVTAAVVRGAGTGEQPPELSELPEVSFAGTAPAPGSVLSLSRNELYVFILVTGRAVATFNISWTFQLMGVGLETVCASFSSSGRLTPSAVPATVTLTGRVFASGDCGERFDVDRARLRVLIRGQIAFDEILTPLPFHFEP